MQRTQISLTVEERHLLDAAAKSTGRSIAALIRDAVQAVYGTERSDDDDVAAMRAAFGSWKGNHLNGADLNGADQDGAEWVERLRSGSRLSGT